MKWPAALAVAVMSLCLAEVGSLNKVRLALGEVQTVQAGSEVSKMRRFSIAEVTHNEGDEQPQAGAKLIQFHDTEEEAVEAAKARVDKGAKTLAVIEIKSIHRSGKPSPQE